MFRKKILLVVIAFALVINSAAFPTSVRAFANIYINTDADNTLNDGLCSLREAIINANDDAATFSDCLAGMGDDTIYIDQIYTNPFTTIVLGSPLPAISDPAGLVIDGEFMTTISGAGLYQVFTVNANVPLTLAYITVADGYIGSLGNGGGVQNNGGMLTIVDSTFSNNSSSGNGSAIYNEGSLTIDASTFSNNSAAGSGAVWNETGTLNIKNSTFSVNHGNGSGGGVSNHQGTASIINSTFSGNTDANGGAIWNNSTLDLNNTILSNSGSGRDCYNTLGASATGTNNLISTTNANYTCGLTNGVNGNLVGFSAGLGALTGSPAYYPLDRNSLAIDTGNDAVCNLLSSQNGVSRPVGKHCDIGSVEFLDPVIPNLAWNKFQGEPVTLGYYSYGSQSLGIAADGSGNSYVAGYSSSTWGNPIQAFTPGVGMWGVPTSDAFVAKLDSSGNLIWNTFLGTVDDERAQSVAIDGSGYIYITGYEYASVNPLFVAKFDSSGTLVWNSLLSGDAASDADIAVDESGNVYVSSTSYTTWGTPVTAHAGGYDVSIAKLDSSGSLVWNTFLGGAGSDGGNGITVKNGHIYVEGFSNASWGAPLRSYTWEDVFSAKLDASSGVLLWNTFLGGDGTDIGSGIAVDESENVFITGGSRGSWGNPVRAFSGGGFYSDSFSAKLDSSGVLIWNTFLGGGEHDNGGDIAVDGSGGIFVTGYSQGIWDTPFPPPQNISHFIANLDPSGVLTQHVFGDFGTRLAVDGNGYGYVAGSDNQSRGTVAKLYLTLPYVMSSVRADSNLTTAASVNFTVDFSESVTGVDTSDFSLTTSGVSGAAVSGVSGSGSSYTVTVNTGSGSGTIQLNVIDNDSILDASLNPLGDTGIGNGSYLSGEVYTIVKPSTFTDIPLFYWSNSYIERLYNAGITGGCTAVPLNYCPTNSVTRAQMAVFLVRAMHGVAFVPPTATG
ncbi:MAG: hypothetical protein HY863_19670, partial [Chloroflexi bacterium]|nr:hypothetical protein [Chloroflexota bacterium]